MKAKLQIINEQKEKGLFMANVIVIALLVLAVGGAGIAIFRKKKNGKGCHGCSMADSCPHKH
ncbi:MAG: FeoB-associated Cys-rich membrane protein [Lachnospiraceae bacterium]|nr:FeoB-associated Cys-rich membrane protein [Lachnospiraceae bacterium]MCR5268182.1 FeoB-associated Cys-rich membrane protein [Lachnospiraceae bacterium]